MIYETQKELYSKEELEVVEEKITKLSRKISKEKTIPKQIECPKCTGTNAFENEKCCFCGYKLGKSQYYTSEHHEDIENSESFTFQYVISFIIPLIVFIIGAILLTKYNEEKANRGENVYYFKYNIINIFSISVL